MSFLRYLPISRFSLLTMGGLILLLLFLIFSLVHWSPDRTIRRNQDAFLRGLEAREPSQFDQYIAESYKDRWGFSKAEMTASYMDIATQIMLVVLKNEETKHERAGKRALNYQTIELSAKPLGPLGQVVIQKANQLEGPWEFTWEKQSAMPWSWQIVEIDHPELPKNLFNYKPGSIRNALEGL
ncbi:MAG: hypothetical protein AAF226_05450 [Verrucomicrobiota bacterium]